MKHHSLGPYGDASTMTQPGHFWIDDLEVIAMVFGIASLAGDGDTKLVLVHFVLRFKSEEMHGRDVGKPPS